MKNPKRLYGAGMLRHFSRSPIGRPERFGSTRFVVILRLFHRLEGSSDNPIAEPKAWQEAGYYESSATENSKCAPVPGRNTRPCFKHTSAGNMGVKRKPCFRIEARKAPRMGFFKVPLLGGPRMFQGALAPSFDCYCRFIALRMENLAPRLKRLYPQYQAKLGV